MTVEHVDEVQLESWQALNPPQNFGGFGGQGGLGFETEVDQDDTELIDAVSLKEAGTSCVTFVSAMICSSNLLRNSSCFHCSTR